MKKSLSIILSLAMVCTMSATALQPTVQLTYLLSQTQQFKLRKQTVKVEQLRTPLIIWTTL